ncbi:SDR family oxidoreductase [Altericista sp. CCNU0014]|uniref:SDR family oxidoreductase n=1 Tax=Altericista sp. CCNU0014 TaxID=3082949 RepID=UPI003850325E
MSFERHHAIITGGSSGIGKALALKLARAGAHVTLIARTPSTLEAARAEIELARKGVEQRVLALTADVARADRVMAAIETAIAQLGPPDMLVTSAGIAHPGHFRELPLSVFEQTMATNYFGSLYSIRAALPAMEARRKGSIVLISSGAGLVGLYGYTPYSPSKFALRGLAESLRGELKPYGIHLAIVYPPDTDTPQLQAENLTKPLATQMITATAKTWTADAVADAILRGVRQKAFAITPGLEMSLLAKLHSAIAPGFQWYCDRMVAKATKREQ